MNLPFSIETITDYCKNNPYTTVAVVAACTGTYFYLTSGKSKSKSFPKSELAKPGLVVIHGMGPATTSADPSPYVLKLQTFLRITNTDYVFDRNNPFGRKGKMPWIELDGKDYCDSTFIIEHLTKTFNISIDDNLSDKQKATARVIQKTVEENTIWAAIVYNYFVEDPDWFISIMKYHWFIGKISKLLFIPTIKKKLYGHGIGRHSRKEIQHIARGDLKALSDLLGDKPFFFGDEPSTIDACVFGLTANLIYGLRQGNWANVMIKSEFPNLVAYTNRIKERYWSDWDEVVIGE